MLEDEENLRSSVAVGLAVKEAIIGEEYIKAHGMNCGSHGEMFASQK